MSDYEDEAVAIRLSRQPPFQLGAVEVLPATRQVVVGGRSETLEPRIMQVLVALANYWERTGVVPDFLRKPA